VSTLFSTVLLAALAAGPAIAGEDALLKVGDHSLRVLTSDVLELISINTKDPDPARVTTWNLVDANYQFQAPLTSDFLVTANGQAVVIQSVLGFKRRPLYAPYWHRDLRIQNSLYLKLSRAVLDDQVVEVKNPTGTLWTTNIQYIATVDPERYSPLIHVNQEGYLPTLPKKALVGYYLGSSGELSISASLGFKIVNDSTGAQVYQGSLVWKPDVGYSYTPTPYQNIYVADFSSVTNPGTYRLVIPYLGSSLPFQIDGGIGLSFARAYALGLYHQRCGASNAFPFTRFTHGPCHTNKSDVPSPQSSFAFTWNTISNYSADYTNNPRHTAPQLKSEATQLYPFVNLGKIDVSGGHHDAGDYSKYTINSAGLIHYLIFAVDAFAGVASLDNLGLPESGNGISDLMEEAKIEADFLAKMQDADGGFYFLVYPKNREYEYNVLPDQGDPQVVWPKTTAVTAAGVAALAEMASSPRFKQQYPASAMLYMQKAQLGWKFLTNAVARFGKDGSYQKITTYGDEFMHDDELAWAACEMYLATTNAAYQQKLFAWFPNPDDSATFRYSWSRLYDSYGKAIRSYAFAARTGRLTTNQLDSTYLGKCVNELTLGAQDHLVRAQDNAYGTSFPLQSKSYRQAGWYFSGGPAFDLAVAYQLSARSDFLEALLSNLNYEAGANPVNICYVSGLGTKRQREIVHQYAQNDRRVLPPSGFPIGNIQAGFDGGDAYQSEQGALCFPQEWTTTAPYPFYDRWADAYDYETEFVVLDLARSLASTAFLATFGSTKTQAWVSAAAQIVAPTEAVPTLPLTATLNAPGLDLSRARVVWEALGQEPFYGTNYTFTPASNGVTYWIEAEAQWPDGRRVFASTNVFVTNRPPTISVEATDPIGWRVGPDPAVFTISRAGNANFPMTVNFSLGGTATGGIDYRTVSNFVTLAAGATSTNLVIMPVAGTNVIASKTVILAISANTNYLVGATNSTFITIAGNSGPITSTEFASGAATLTWASVAGKVYQVLYKNSLSASNWSTFSTNITASGSLTTWTDATATAPQRYYRISQVH